jgi:hypothetical protein
MLNVASTGDASCAPPLNPTSSQTLRKHICNNNRYRITDPLLQFPWGLWQFTNICFLLDVVLKWKSRIVRSSDRGGGGTWHIHFSHLTCYGMWYQGKMWLCSDNAAKGSCHNRMSAASVPCCSWGARKSSRVRRHKIPVSVFSAKETGP